ncbi:MAG: bifunctional rhamnulose-1-phosphate aldolase/short-chain dehydrogenase [Bryobacteraceae bacterium]|nr:bifunctional rhamnulose-1-phosphate aldolase/short-chain dehydrogenase [Bryobacteraceae bacterium]
MLKLLDNLWQESLDQDELDLLRYRSNLLGADLRITNFGGGNTSSKISMTDPLTGLPTTILAVKGSGGDLGSIRREGFALLYMERLEQLKLVYRGEQFEDEMVSYYPLCTFGTGSAPASIDTPLHAFLPFQHVDHLHPDWAIAIAASANGKARLEEFNSRFGHKVVWLPWQRPGFELGLMLQRAVEEHPDCDGILLGSHGLFTWGETHELSYVNSLRMIDDMGQFVTGYEGKTLAFGGQRYTTVPDPEKTASAILPYLRGKVAGSKRSIGHFNASADVLSYVNSNYAPGLSALGTSCPDHFIRTRVAPLFVNWDPTGSEEQLRDAIDTGMAAYRARYTSYYEANREPGSPAMRDSNPTVVLVPGIGMFTFARTKKEARITGEFYVNAIHVMSGGIALGGEASLAVAAGNGNGGVLPQAKTPEVAGAFTSLHNYVALPPREAFRIEYWALEEAKIQRMPREQEFSRRVLIVAGGGAGIGREVALQLAHLGAHVMVADKNAAAAEETEALAAKIGGAESVSSCSIDITSRESIREAFRKTVLQFGSFDGVINTAAVFLPADGSLDEEHWSVTLNVNVTANYLLADEAKKILLDQKLPAVIVLTSSANAVVPKRGSEAYDVSKAAVNHLIGELAVGLKPLIRVNGIAPATVVEGSTMFPRERVIPSLNKYNLPWSEDQTTDQLRDTLANFYASRTLTNAPIRPRDCAEAIVWLASDRSSRTTGHVIPVDGGLPEAFLR